MDTSVHSSQGTAVIGATNNFTNDTLLTFGTGNDVVLLDRSTALAANTAVTNVLIGTPVSIAVAADTLIISNTTAAGDIALYGNRGGNSEQFMFMDVSTGVLYLTPYAGGLMVGLTASPPAPDNANMVHIWQGSAGAATMHSTVTLGIEADTGQRLELLTPAANFSSISFASPTGIRGELIYFNDSYAGTPDTFEFDTAGVNRLLLSAGSFAFQTAFTISTIAATNLTLNALTTGSVLIQSGGTTGFQVNNTGIGLYAVTPVARAGAIAAPTGGGTIDAEARTAINSIRVALTNIGLTS